MVFETRKVKDLPGLSKNYTDAPVSGIMKETGAFFMEQRKMDA